MMSYLHGASPLYENGQPMDEAKGNQIKLDFGYEAYKLAKNFDSDHIEVIILGTALAQDIINSQIY